MFTLLALHLERKMNVTFHGRFILALALDGGMITYVIEMMK